MDLTLKADTGRTTGTRSSRRLRAEGQVPATVYGLSQEPVTVSVAWPDLRRVLTTEAGTNALIQLELEGERNLTIVKDLQRHPVRRDVIHVDFLRLDPDADIEVEVPIVLTGHAQLVEQRGGMVDQFLYTLTVSSRPDAIPSQLELDISRLDVGDTSTVAEIALPPGVTTNVAGDDPVASGTQTRAALEAERGEGEEDEEGEEGDAGEGGEAADGDES